MTLGLWISIAIVCGLIFGIPEEQNPIEIKTKTGEQISISVGERITINADGSYTKEFVGYEEDEDTSDWEVVIMED